MKISLATKCPCCGDRDVHRIRRKVWMRLLPFSKYYFCSNCYTHFVRLLRVLTV